jgi:broad specificity phosphatase PhoE
MDDLMEWNYGEIEGQTNDDIVAKWPFFDKWSAKQLPGGETVEDVGKRVTNVIEKLREAAEDGPVLVTAHGHLLSILIAVWLGLHPREGRRFVLETATASVLGVKRGDQILRLLNHRLSLVTPIPQSDEQTIAYGKRY